MSEEKDKQSFEDVESLSSNLLEEIVEKNTERNCDTAESAHQSSEVKESALTETVNSTGDEEQSKQSSFKSDVNNISGNATIAQQINNETKNNITNITTIGGVDGVNFCIKKFSISDTIRMSNDSLEEVYQTFVYPAEDINGLFSSLISNRILLLVGEPESGKCFSAKYLSIGIMKRSKRDYEVRLVKPVAKELIIDLSDLIDDPKMLANRILIFKDVFSGKNMNLHDFFASYTKEQTGFFSEKLRELDAYFLFTADKGTYDEFQISRLDIKAEISLIDNDLIKKGFEVKLEHFCSSRPIDLKNVSEILKENLPEIFNKMNRMSYVSMFIENYLEKILTGEKSIEEAIEEVVNTERRVAHWFLKELGGKKEEFEAWTFTMFLALLNKASYFEFEQIHKVITKKLLRTITPYSLNREFSFTLSESDLFTKCEAQITRDTYIHADVIEFRDPKYQKILLDTLFKNNRRILISIIPYLKEYAENPYQPDLRRLAAYSIGRIGELDLESIALHFIRGWAHMEESFFRANVGYLFEGILSSDDESYKNFCMGVLKNMALSNNIKVQWTAISAYKQIGLHDLKLAIEELRKIQEEIIKRMLKTENILDLFYRKGASEEDILQDLDVLYKKSDYLLSNVRYSIVALCIMINPIDVISELCNWINEGNRNTKITVVLIFLGSDGILQVLENRKIIHLSKEDENSLSSNVLLNSLTIGDEAIKKAVQFLRDIYKKCFSKFQLNDHEELKKILNNYLEKWTIDTLSKKKVNSALKKLIVELYRTGDDDLQNRLWDSLNRWEIPEKKENDDEKEKENRREREEKEAKLKAFVDDVTRQILGKD